MTCTQSRGGGKNLCISTSNVLFPIEFERRVITASAEVQNSVGCSVSFHPGRKPESAFDILRIFQEAGGKAERMIMSHLDSKLDLLDRSLLVRSLLFHCRNSTGHTNLDGVC